MQKCAAFCLDSYENHTKCTNLIKFSFLGIDNELGAAKKIVSAQHLEKELLDWCFTVHGSERIFVVRFCSMLSIHSLNRFGPNSRV